MFSRHHPSIVLSILMAVILLVQLPLSEDGEGGPSTEGEITPASMPTRSVFDESENNNQWQEADQLPSSHGTFELHGNLTVNDNDLFYINMNGGNGPNVDRITIDMDYLDTNYWYELVFVLIYAFYPDDDLQGNNLDENIIHLRYWDRDNLFGTTAATADATYSGIYGVRIVAQNGTGAPVSGNIGYNFTVTYSSVPSVDTNNDEDNPQSLSVPYTGSIDQNQDMMDWFEIDAPHSVHPTELDLIFSFSNPTPNDSGSGIDYGIEADLYIRYNSRANPSQFSEEIRKISPNPTFQSAGLKATPYNLKLNKNCTKMIIGMVIQTFGLDSNNPNINNKQYTAVDGSSQYSITGTISAYIPNNRPILTDASVMPRRGRSNEMYNFSVTYFDANNHTPEQIWLWKDGSPFRELSPLNGSGQDNTLGVAYGVSVPGSILGKNQAHTMNFSVYDGEDWARQEPSGLNTFIVVVDDNLPPSSLVGETYDIFMEEDESTREIELDPLVTDPDPLTDFDFYLLGSSGGWTTTYSDENITGVISMRSQTGPHVLRITPKKDRHGTFVLTVNATDNGVFAKSVYMDVIVHVEDVNDDPEIRRVANLKVEEDAKTLTLEYEQDENVTLDIAAEDIDTSDILHYDWNLEEVISDPREGVNYGINHTTGEMWFIPGDSDVPEVAINLIVTDGRGGEDEIEVLVTVDNINDPPVLTVPKLRTTIEGEYLYITPSVFDPDLDNPGVNEQLIFNYDIGALALKAPPNAAEFDPLTAAMVSKAVDERMSGQWEVNITVSDLALGSDFGICQIIIENLNDPPVAGSVFPEVEEGNLTVRFTTSEAEDEDGDQLTYIWDFGDGTEPFETDERIATHTYPRGGSYTVTMMVSDGEAVSEEETTLISLTEPDPDPDQDDDGMDDSWEIRYGLDPNDPSDAEEDPDGDGLTNLEEFNLFRDVGWELNPMNPDTDEDGWKDGEEVDRAYDPLDPGEHPEGEYEGIPELLYVLALVIMVLAVLFALVFLVLRKRNKPKAVASAAMPSSGQPQYQMMPGAADQYQAMPPAQYESLPPARQEEPEPGYYRDEAAAESYEDQEQYPYQQEQAEGDLYSGWQQPPQEGDAGTGYADQQEIPQYQPPAEGYPGYETPREQDAPIKPPGSVEGETGSIETRQQFPVNDEIEYDNTADDENSSENASQNEGNEAEKPLSRMPPPPSLPDDL
jgi:hypothetical protein